ncbi:MAG: uroporphyrinogen decarboxylase family protein [Eubacteriales bacterium]
MISKEELYQQRMDLMMKTVNHEEADRVPVFALIGTWGISYYGTTVRECLKDRQWHIKEVEAKIYRDMNCDIIMSAGLINNFEFDEIVGGGTQFISDDGVTIQHKEGVGINVEDYPKMIRDPWDFFITEFIPRTHPDITIEKMVQAVRSMMRGFEEMSWIPEYYKNEFGLIYLISGGGYVYPPLDMLFDFLRGFKGTLTDIRRIPEWVLEAVEALYPITEGNIPILDTDRNLKPFPFPMTMLHSPTYLSSKQFEKFFAPTYERLLKRIHAAGKKMFVYLEGEWAQHYDWLNSLPKDFLIGIVEKDDIIKMKKKVGDNITLVGGMPLNVLKFESKQYCIDYAKQIVDECAPGGGFIFSTDKVLQCPGDVNPENYITVNNFVYGYGG